MMKLRFMAGTAIALAGLALTSGAQARDLSVVSWGGAYQDAQKQVYFEPFKQAAGVALKDETWDGGLGPLRKQVESGEITWDLVQVESEELKVGCGEGLFEKLDYKRIGGKDAYLPETADKCGVGSIVYDFVIGYDKDKLKEAPKSWADFFDTTKFPGKRALRNGPKTTLEIALMADGVAPKDVYKVLATKAGVDRAFKKLDTIKKDLVFWKGGAEPPKMLASGDVVMASVYNGRIDAANKADGRNFGKVWSGALYTIDSWVILKGAPNKEAAYKLLDFMGKAENQAKLSEHMPYGTSNKGAADLISKDVLANLPTAPENLKAAVQIDDQFWIDNVEVLNERFAKWQAAK